MTGLGEENFSGLSDELMEKYKEHFGNPEQFFKIGGRLVVAEMPTHDHGSRQVSHSSHEAR